MSTNFQTEILDFSGCKRPLGTEKKKINKNIKQYLKNTISIKKTLTAAF